MPERHPILYSFRRCPYAMRARLAISSAGIACELREIVLRDKAAVFLKASPKGTVPVVVDRDDSVIEESYDIMLWALSRSDPENWLGGPREQTGKLIEQADGPFKSALDRYKYANRYEGADALGEREKAMTFIAILDDQLSHSPYLFGAEPRLADMAILPFIRQFAFVNRDWFAKNGGNAVNRWLDDFVASPRFSHIFRKYEKWVPGASEIIFPPE